MTETVRPLILMVLLAACTPAELSVALDGGGAPTGDVLDSAAPPPDAATPPPDAPLPLDVTAPATDGAVVDTAMQADAAPGVDRPALDVDVPTAVDVPAAVDVLSAVDAPALRDVAGAIDVSVPRDAGPSSDVPPAPRDVVAATDVPSPTDAGCAVTARVVAPAADEVIETCSASGAAVFYDFRVNVTGPATLLQPRWRTPDGDLAPSPDLTRTQAPWVFRRQVGGPSTAAPALGVFPNALRGTWRFEVVATHQCGAETIVSQPFQLTFTNRRCPNP